MRALERSCLEPRRAKSSGSIAFSSAVSVGSSWKNWKTMPTWRPRQIASCSSLIASIRWPSTVTVPAVGRSMPVIMFMIVDLPLPDGPTIATISPLCDRQVDAAQRRVLELAGPVDLLDALEADQRGTHCGGGTRGDRRRSRMRGRTHGRLLKLSYVCPSFRSAGQRAPSVLGPPPGGVYPQPVRIADRPTRPLGRGTAAGSPTGAGRQRDTHRGPDRVTGETTRTPDGPARAGEAVSGHNRATADVEAGRWQRSRRSNKERLAHR